jgi:hypothetical protein
MRKRTGSKALSLTDVTKIFSEHGVLVRRKFIFGVRGNSLEKQNKKSLKKINAKFTVQQKIQCCGSGMFIPDPDFYPSRIPDLGSPISDPGSNFQRILELFTQQIVTKLSKIWVWDPGSGKNPFRIPDPGVKKAPIPDPDPQH